MKNFVDVAVIGAGTAGLAAMTEAAAEPGLLAATGKRLRESLAHGEQLQAVTNRTLTDRARRQSRA